MTTEQKWYVYSGCVDRNFYDNFIKDEITKTAQKKFEELLGEEEDGEIVEYYRIGVANPADCKWEYSTLWFFDLGYERGYLPVYKSRVNTSSAFAMCSCGMDRDDDEEDKEYNLKTLEELLEFAPSDKSKEAIREILTQKK